MRAIYSDHSPLRSDLVGSKDDVYPASAAEIYNHITRPNTCESSGVPTTPREVESHFWH